MHHLPRLTGQESDSLLEAVLAAPVGVCILNGQGTVVACNDPFGRMLGWEPAAMVGTGFRDHVAAEDLPDAEEHGSALLEGDDRRQLEHRYRTATGRTVWANVVGRPWHLCEGELRLLFVAQDITAMKETEARLRESEEQFRVAFEQAPFPMCTVDLDRRF